MTFASIALPTRATPRRFALIVALAFAITAIGLLVAPGPTDAWSSGQYNSTSEKQLVALTNQSRAAAGLKSLKVDSTLTSIARGRSKDMIVRGYFSHSIPPSGKNVFSILDSKGYCYAIAGENIGWNNYPDNTATKTVHRMFMESPGHRSNVLGKRWDVIGIGAYKGPTGKKMWTVLFADKCGGSSGGGTTHEDELGHDEVRPEGDAQADPEADARPDARSDDAARSRPIRSSWASAAATEPMRTVPPALTPNRSRPGPTRVMPLARSACSIPRRRPASSTRSSAT